MPFTLQCYMDSKFELKQIKMYATFIDKFKLKNIYTGKGYTRLQNYGRVAISKISC
jgi:hypothetical protein